MIETTEILSINTTTQSETPQNETISYSDGAYEDLYEYIYRIKDRKFG